MRPQLRVDADDWKEGRDQLNRILERLQGGYLPVNGVKFAVRVAVPSDPPGAGDANVVLVNAAGTHKLYLFDLATGWVVVGTQT